VELVIFLFVTAVTIGAMLLVVGAVVIVVGALIWALVWGVRRLAYHHGTRTGTLLAGMTVLYFLGAGGSYGMTLYPPTAAYGLPVLVWSTLGFVGVFLFLDFTSGRRDVIARTGQWRVMSPPPQPRGLIEPRVRTQEPFPLLLPGPRRTKHWLRRFFP